MKLLIVYLQPKDIPEVLEEMDDIQYDQLRLKYNMELPALTEAQKFFHDNKEYTHMVIVTNDVVSTQKHMELLEQTLYQNHDKPVISGVMNVEQDGKDWNICINDIIPEPDGTLTRANYPWVKAYSVTGLIKVKFSGFPLMAIPRWLLEIVPINTRGQAEDLMFCNRLNMMKIPIYANTEIVLKHLCDNSNQSVGVKEPETVFIKDGKQTVMSRL